MDLILIRHALPQRLRVAEGGVADPPLAEEGRMQARRLARWLAGEGVDAVYSSPMRRALETAELLSLPLGVSPRSVPELLESDSLSREYVPLEEIKRSDPTRWRQLVAGRERYAGVDLRAFQRRVVAALDAIIAAHRGQRVVASTHGSVINAFTAALLGLPDPFVFEPVYTGISRFRAARTGQRSIVSLNETGHLRDAR